MFAYVRLLSGFQDQLLYRISDELVAQVKPGTLVLVPFRSGQVSARVEEVLLKLPADISFNVRDIIGLEQMPLDTNFEQFIRTIASFYLLEEHHFLQRIRSFLKEDKAEKIELSGPELVENNQVVQLTVQQQSIVEYLAPCITQGVYAPTLVHGVTGSGKTEVYKRLIEQAIAQNKSVVMLLPEVSLAMQFQRLLTRHLPNVTVIGFHSATQVTEKRRLWQLLLAGKPVLVIGVHLPILLPMSNLGLIIIDEEHEQGFLEKKHPKLNSKEIALWRAKIYKIPILLGSATPSLTSLRSVETNGWKFFQITERFAGKFPVIQKVLLTQQEGRRRKHFWVSKELEAEVRRVLSRKEQVIIYLNRRGFSFFVQCKECGFIFQCASCSVSLTLHRNKKQSEVRDVLRCHYCDFQKNLPPACPECKVGGDKLLKKGIGTQQVVEIFKNLFPEAVIERADLDSTSKKRSWEETVARFERGEINILIGTKTITKGYHFPRVTLVGILWADLNLHFPVYNAAEVTLQQIIQVAGRAGRGCLEGKVIIQLLADHPVFDYVDEQRYLDFCKEELAMRQLAQYPPTIRLATIELRHSKEIQVDADGARLKEFLENYSSEHNLGIRVNGPCLPVVHKIASYEMRNITIRAASFQALHRLLKAVQHQSFVSDIFIMISQQ